MKLPEGDLIDYRDGKVVIGDRPVIGVLLGDGIRLDISPVIRTVVDTAVPKAFGGQRDSNR